MVGCGLTRCLTLLWVKRRSIPNQKSPGSDPRTNAQLQGDFYRLLCGARELLGIPYAWGIFWGRGHGSLPPNEEQEQDEETPGLVRIRTRLTGEMCTWLSLEIPGVPKDSIVGELTGTRICGSYTYFRRCTPINGAGELAQITGDLAEHNIYPGGIFRCEIKFAVLVSRTIYHRMPYTEAGQSTAFGGVEQLRAWKTRFN
ncbi:hypothetical protein B0H13DRAFT_1904361 [Mycena leptocephala]|nr:hypothetical protein B0H13DRAFT_1904361 [Mycena leptocephala]